jgi:YVTN family beta-propeller protein
VQKIDPAMNQVVDSFDVDGQPCGIVYVNDFLWVGSVSGQMIDQIDPDSGEIVEQIPTGGQVYDVQAGFGSVWVANHEGNQVLRIDPATAKVVAHIPAGKLLYGLAVTEDGVWATAQLDNTVIRIDPATNKRVDVINDPQDQPFTFAATPGALWVTHRTGVTSKLDTATDRFVAASHSGSETAAGDPATVAGAVWVPDRITGDLARIDPATAKVTARVFLGVGFSVAQAGFGDLWVANFGNQGLARIDPDAI